MTMNRRSALLALLPLGVHAQAQWSPPQLPDVALQDQDGRAWRLSSELAAAQPLVVSFMFTSCAAACPPQTAALRELRRALDADAALRDVLLLSITVDPLADGPAQLSAYAQRYGISAGRDAGWLFLTGERAALAKTWRAFGVDASPREAHPSLVWVAHAARERWSRTSALNATPEVLRTVREVVA
jgi:protein SCO1